MKVPNTIEELVTVLRPYIASLVNPASASSGSGLTTHALSGPSHSGTLSDSQGPQFLKVDGTRTLWGNLTVADDVTVDGVDVSDHYADYLVHKGDEDAHHTAFVGLTDDATTLVSPEDTGDTIKVAGGAGLSTSAGTNVLTVSLDTPGTLSVSSTNSSTSPHTHAITASEAPGVASALLKTNSSGLLRLLSFRLELSGSTPGKLSFGTSSVQDAWMCRPDTSLLRIDGDGTGTANVDVALVGSLTVGSATKGSAKVHIIDSTLPLRLANDVTYYADLIVSSGGNLQIEPVGDIILDPAGQDVSPGAPYFVRLGSLQNKYLALHCAELWVETLVAHDTMATIGGRILVGPTTTLEEDVSLGYDTVSTIGHATNSGTGFTASVNLPGSYQDGDLVIVAVWNEYEPLVYPGTLIGSYTIGNGADLYLYQKFIDGESSETVELQYAQPWILTATVYRNAQITDTDYDTGTGTSAAFLNVTLETDGYFYGALTGSSLTATHSPPSGFTELTDNHFDGAMDDCHAVVMHGSFSGGNPGNKTSTLSASETWKTVSVAVTGAKVISTKHNNMSAGDICYSEADGKVEFWRVLSDDIGSDPYRYVVQRDLDGSGQNAWYAGDALFNTGQAGNGFIDLYSVRGVKSASQYGPTVVCNVRNSNTYNDWSPRSALGNLNGLYGYGTDTFGWAVGSYASGKAWLSGDETNGIRISQYTSVLARWANDGTITIGNTSDPNPNVYITSSALKLRKGTTDKIVLESDGDSYFAGAMSIDTSGGIWQGTGTFASPTDAVKLYNSSGIGRFAAFASGTLCAWLDHTGINLLSTSAAGSGPRSVNWRSSVGGTVEGFISGGTGVQGATGVKVEADGVQIGKTGSYIYTTTTNPSAIISYVSTTHNFTGYVNIGSYIDLDDTNGHIISYAGYGKFRNGLILGSTLDTPSSSQPYIYSQDGGFYTTFPTSVGAPVSYNAGSVSRIGLLCATEVPALLIEHGAASYSWFLYPGSDDTFNIARRSTTTSVQMKIDYNLGLWANGLALGPSLAPFSNGGGLKYEGDLIAYRSSTNHTGYIYCLLSTPQTPWNNATPSTGTTTFTLSDYSIPSSAKAIYCNLMGQWASASGSSYIYLRKASSGEGLGSVRVSANTANVPSCNAGLVDTSGGTFEAYVAGTVTAAYLRIYGYFI